MLTQDRFSPFDTIPVNSLVSCKVKKKGGYVEVITRSCFPIEKVIIIIIISFAASIISQKDLTCTNSIFPLRTNPCWWPGQTNTGMSHME